MACSDVYPSAGARREHVTELNAEMLAAELDGRTCPRCDCRQSRPVQSDNADNEEVAGLPLRVCVACNEVYGFDDSTCVPDHLLQSGCGDHGIWPDHVDDYPRLSGPPCFWTDAAVDCVGSENDNDDEEAEDRDNDQHHSEFSDPPRRGRRKSGGGHRGRAGGHHCREDHHHYHHQHQHQRGRGQRRYNGGRGRGSTQAPSNARDQWKQVADTCLESGKKCVLGAAPDLIAGRYDGAVAIVSDQFEPVGRAVGSAFGCVAGDLIGSPQAGDIGTRLGSTVGHGVAEMLKTSSFCNRRTSSHDDD